MSLAKLAMVLAAFGPSLLVLALAGCSRRAVVIPQTEPPVAEGYPRAILANDHLKLTIYLPDAEKGYYRAMRFDWSGQVGRAEFAGHTAFGQWQKPHDPLAHDHVVGPAEEFGMDSPLGYEEAEPGQPFYKIGVGTLEKTDGEPYKFWDTYRFLAAPAWKVTCAEDRIEFVQELVGERGWAYEYAKRIVLDAERAAFTIHHTLRNTGAKPIETTMYYHNFIILDDEPIGPAYRVTYPFVPEIVEGSLEDLAEFKANALIYTAAMPADKAQWVRLGGFEGKRQHNRVAVTNEKTGARVKIGSSLPPVKVVYYATCTAACPEFFVPIRVAPGERLQWSGTYAFEVAEPKAR
ncbi:MAG: hypothetical protein WBD63_01645 [Phycisphaerae bacterium]|nr:hypothetical protein [Phycisphaerae bacterium]